jgi:hypothetical protein
LDECSIKAGMARADAGEAGKDASMEGIMTSSRTLTRARITATLAAAVGALLLIAPAAHAGPLVAADPNCAEEDLTRPFLPWADVMQYQFAPDGGFESGGAGWALSGGAAPAGGNESHYVHDSGDSASLAVPAGGRATSPTVCVGIEHPAIRFFAKRTSGLLATAAVEVLFEDANGNVLSAPIGTVAGTVGWQPTLPMPIVANLLPLLPGDHTPVKFRITGLTGGMKIDDFYVDPRRTS